jgi:hypothetical protein
MRRARRYERRSASTRVRKSSEFFRSARTWLTLLALRAPASSRTSDCAAAAGSLLKLRLPLARPTLTEGGGAVAFERHGPRHGGSPRGGKWPEDRQFIR